MDVAPDGWKPVRWAGPQPLLRRRRRGRAAPGRHARRRRRPAPRRARHRRRMTILIRPARPEDAATLVALGAAVGREPEGWLLNTDGWRSVGEERRYLRALRRHPDAAVFVAEDDGAIVGRLSVARDPHSASRHVADLGLMVAAEPPPPRHRPRAARAGGRVGARGRCVASSSCTSSPGTSRRSSSTSGSASSARGSGRRTTAGATSTSTRS